MIMIGPSYTAYRVTKEEANEFFALAYIALGAHPTPEQYHQFRRDACEGDERFPAEFRLDHPFAIQNYKNWLRNRQIANNWSRFTRL